MNSKKKGLKYLNLLKRINFSKWFIPLKIQNNLPCSIYIKNKFVYHSETTTFRNHKTINILPLNYYERTGFFCQLCDK